MVRTVAVLLTIIAVVPLPGPLVMVTKSPAKLFTVHPALVTVAVAFDGAEVPRKSPSDPAVTDANVPVAEPVVGVTATGVQAMSTHGPSVVVGA